MKRWLSLLCLLIGLLIILTVGVAFLTEMIATNSVLTVVLVGDAIRSIWLIIFLLIGLIFITLWAILR